MYVPRLIPVLVCVFGLSAQEPPIRLSSVTTGVAGPTDIQSARDGSNRLFFVQQNGIIRVMRNGALLSAPFLDIRSRTMGTGERGLLGLAFPPGYAQKQYFYVNYTTPGANFQTIIARYRVTSNPDIADPDSETVLLRIDQPFSNHNGGQLQFGPDGYLYIGMGDGGSGGDPQNNAQNRNTLLGKMLRLDVESQPSEVRIPPTNPFVNQAGARPEIWAFGLRNPWRFSFDRANGNLFIADVGQNRFEEVNFQPAASGGGENYGWRLMEGFECFTAGCDPAGLTLPVHAYPRSEGCSVTGGYVYRGTRSSSLRGTYIYGDYCTGRIWGITREGDRWVNRLLLDSDLSITTFGEDEAGEIYAGDAGRGEIHLILGGDAPRFTSSSVVNGASFQPGMVAGSIATIFAAGLRDSPGITSAQSFPLPLTMDGISVTVNGRQAPLYAVANVNGQEQVNLQTPFEIAGAASAEIVIRRGDTASAAVTAPVLAAQPGVFATGRNAIVVFHQDNTLVTPEKPLRPGDLAYFYATGLGPVENPPPTGLPTPHAPFSQTLSLPRVTIGGISAELLFAGLAPDLAGVFQINIRVPALAPQVADLVLTIDGNESPATQVPVGSP